MTDLVANGYFENAGRTVAEMKAAMDQLQAFLQEQLFSGGVQALTLASDAITPAAGATRVIDVDTQAAAATDDLLSIVTTNVPDGGLVALRNANTSRSVVVKHTASPAAGQISLADGADFTLQDRKTWMILRRNGTTWEEFLRYQPLLNTATVQETGTSLTVTRQHHGKLIQCTNAAGCTLNLTAVATLGKGFFAHVMADGGPVTIDPSGAETINGASTIVLADGDWAIFYVNAAGTAFLCKRPLMQGRQTIPIMAGGMKARVTSGATPASIETTTNRINLNTMDYSGSTQAFAQFAMTMPKEWDEGPMRAMFFWTTPGGATVAQGVVWGIQAVCFNDNDSLDAAFGTAVEVTDALLSTTANVLHRTDETADFTPAGSPAAQELAVFQVYRDPADVNDTMSTINARLLGLLLFIGVNAGNSK